MTKEKAKQLQEDIVRKGFKLSWYYGIKCNKCCDVYPEFKTTSGFDDLCYYQCPVCGTRTKNCLMPWIAEKEWNNNNYLQSQLKLF